MSFATTDKDTLTDVLADAIDLLRTIDDPDMPVVYDPDGRNRDRVLRNLVAALTRKG